MYQKISDVKIASASSTVSVKGQSFFTMEPPEKSKNLEALQRKAAGSLFPKKKRANKNHLVGALIIS